MMEDTYTKYLSVEDFVTLYISEKSVVAFWREFILSSCVHEEDYILGMF